ncbi:MAG: glutaredoxin family protein [Patescibacteria group bacterium]
MKITLYTITDCPFSKQEKEYLSSHTLTFEEKNLETNREFLTEMLAVSNNFAGTPVTKVEKDDGQIAILKGFTREEFDKLLGFSVEPVKSVESAPVPVPTPVVETPPVTVDAVPTPTPVPVPVVETPPASPPAAPVQPVAPDPLANVLSSLEQQVNAVPTPPSPAVAPAQAGTMPTIPDPQL